MNNIDEVRQHVMEKIESAELLSDPFDHKFVENVFPEDFYQINIDVESNGKGQSILFDGFKEYATIIIAIHMSSFLHIFPFAKKFFDTNPNTPSNFPDDTFFANTQFNFFPL